MTTEEKFKAAVNVIRNLPKNGPVQPSNHVMLKFYAYFKQATEGPNTAPKPAFWDLIKKAKWDAWAKLGDMERETAMKNYVEEFKKIVESVSNSNMDVDKSSVDSFYASVPMKDLELVVGPVIQKARSRSNSPIPDDFSQTSDLPQENGIAENDNSKPDKTVIANGDIKHPVVNGKNGVYVNGSCGKFDDEDDDDDFFLDTIENSDQGSRARLTDERLYRNNAQLNYVNEYSNGFIGDSNNNRRCYSEIDIETSLQISRVIISLQKDLEKVVKSVNLIEQRIGQLQGEIVMQKSSKWPFMTSQNIVPFVILFTWPVILQLLIVWFRRKK